VSAGSFAAFALFSATATRGPAFEKNLLLLSQLGQGSEQEGVTGSNGRPDKTR
jgi:hypothetical protein